MPTENQHLEQRVAALQSDLNTKDERIDALTFSDNDRELSRRDWFEAAQEAEKRVEELRGDLASANADKDAYAQNAINLRERLERLKDQRNDYAKQLAERDALLRRWLGVVISDEGLEELEQDTNASLSASAEPSAPCNLAKATVFVERLVYCAGTQQSVATGYLRDVLDVLKGNETPTAPVERDLDDDPFFVQQAEPNSPAPVVQQSSPVERDERAEFERTASSHKYLKQFGVSRFPEDGDDYDAMPLQGAWDMWQARAALDKATEGASHE